MKFVYPLGSLIAGASLSLGSVTPAFAQPTRSPLQTPLQTNNLDPATFAQWVDGKEVPFGDDKSTKATWVVLTRNGPIGFNGINYGDSKTVGVRHLRVGFTEPVTVGTIVTRGGGRLSVLKPDAPYPGNLADDSQWIPAQRLVKGEVTNTEAGTDEYVLWTLPSVTSTRALRFSHEPEVTDRTYAGNLRGVTVIPERLANISPQGVAGASASNQTANRLIDENDNGTWNAWTNMPERDSVKAQTIAEQPEWVTLSWPKQVTLTGLAAIFAGFSAADIQTYTGPADRHPREATEADWKTVKSVTGWKNSYPYSFNVDWVPFDAPLTTRAIRVRMTAVTDEGHPHMKGNTRDGKRVWLGELMALQNLDAAALKTAVLPVENIEVKPPIPVKFTVPADGFVTLVIENEKGERVRNLISDTFFAKGPQVTFWDGANDLGRDTEAAAHGIYHIPTQLVSPGKYTVRGLWHPAIDLRYQFSVNSPGSPPWSTLDNTGGWLTNHSAPSSALFLPAAKSPTKQDTVYVGSAISEGGSALAWLDLEGKKLGGRGWIGGNWTGAGYLATDNGPQAAAGPYAYVATSFGQDNKDGVGEIRLTALTPTGDQAILKYPLDPNAPGFTLEKKGTKWLGAISGLAVRNNLLVVTVPAFNQLLLVDTAKKAVIGTVPFDKGQGVAFDSTGNLLVLNQDTLFRLTVDGTTLGTPVKLISGLQDASAVSVDAAGQIYISQRGDRHQVTSYSPEGKLLKSFGKPGKPSVGAYDPLRMNNPKATAVDTKGRLWVAEDDFFPKRVSVWNADGTLYKAFYGPPAYGGGGSLDPKDSTRYYYADEHGGGLEFKLDWAKGDSKLVNVYGRPGVADSLDSIGRFNYPQNPVYIGTRQYLSNAYNSNPVSGAPSVGLWLYNGSTIKPVAAMGRVGDWPVLRTDDFKARWPEGTDPAGDPNRKPVFFLWNDTNADGQVQPAEVTLKAGQTGGITIQADGSFVLSRSEFDGTTPKSLKLSPSSVSPQGVPLYDLTKAQVLVDNAQGGVSSGGEQVLTGTNGWSIHTNSPKPGSNHGAGGVQNGVLRWTYPSLWNGLHASHTAPRPEFPGELIGTTRLLGDMVTPKGDSGPLFFWNGNHGNIYVFTQDGLFVTSLFQDMRLGKTWRMPVADRNLLLNDVTPGDEHFFPTVSQVPDGTVYVVAGKDFSAINRVDGLDKIQRIAPIPLTIGAPELRLAQDWLMEREAKRQSAQGSGIIRLAKLQNPTVDGKLDDWSDAQWADIDKRGVKAYFDANTKPYDVTGSLGISGDKLYAAWKTGDANLLRNSGEGENALFKTGGALDIMLATDPKADPKRANPVAGDLRLLVTQVAGKPRALLFRAVVPGTPAAQKVPFSSPWRTITFDSVQDVSAQIQFAADGKGNYEVSIPLAALNFAPSPGTKYRADLGILRGNGNQTTQRIYWSNKATAIVADVPSEAQLMPNLWGTLSAE